MVGIVILHPLSEFVYYVEYQIDTASEIDFIFGRLMASLKGEILPLTIGYGVIGGLLGVIFALMTARLAEQNRLVNTLTHELGNSIHSIITGGETARVEFKSSFRWDNKTKKVNKALELGVLKTLAGFMNAQGGTLLIGVSDDGQILGQADDYETLKKRDQDGFEQAIMTAVATTMGAQYTSLLQLVFHQLDGQDICQVIVSPAMRPVYFRQGKERRFYLRSGTGTRELNIQEGVDYIRSRYGR
jgi:hypothetical protein